MGKSKVNTANGAYLIPQRHEAISSLLDTANKNTNFLSDYLKNIITQGPSSSRVQTAVSNYREQVLPQLLGSLGEGKSSSALNQSLSTGAQTLAQNLDADTMGALQMLQELTQKGSSIGLSADFQKSIPKGKMAINTILSLLGGGASLIGGAGGLGGLGGLAALGKLGGKLGGKIGGKIAGWLGRKF